MHPFATKNIIYFCLNPSFIILFCCLIEDMNLEKCLSLAIIILQEDVEVAPELIELGIENKPCAEVFLVVLIQKATVKSPIVGMLFSNIEGVLAKM